MPPWGEAAALELRRILVPCSRCTLFAPDFMTQPVVASAALPGRLKDPTVAPTTPLVRPSEPPPRLASRAAGLTHQGACLPGTACGARLRGSHRLDSDVAGRNLLPVAGHCLGNGWAALGPGGLSRARINRITRSAARGVHGISSMAPWAATNRRSCEQATSGGRVKGSTWNRVDGLSPERPPIDAQLEAFGYVGQGISEQDPAGVPRGTRRPYGGRGDLRSGSAG